MANRYSVQITFNGKDMTSHVLDRITKNVGNAVTKKEKLFKRLHQSSLKAQRGMTNMLRGTAYAAVPAGLALTGMYNNFMQFERQLVGAATKMRLLRGESKHIEGFIKDGGAGFKALSDEIKRVGRETEHTAVQMAEVAGLMGQSGFGGELATATLWQASRHATATGVDPTLGFEYVRKAMGAMGKLRDKTNPAQMALDYAEASNILAYAANNSATNQEEFSEAIKYAGAMAETSGWSFKETAAALMALADGGLEGSIAGTGLQRVLTQIVAGAPKSQKAIRAINAEIIDIKNGAKELKDPVRLFNALGNAMEGLDDVDRIKVMSDLFGLIGLKSGDKLIKGATTSIGRYLEGLDTMGDYTERLAQEQDRTLWGSFKRLNSAISDFNLQVGELTGSDLGKKLDEWAVGLRNNKAAAEETAWWLSLIIDNAGKLIIGFGSLIAATGILFFFNNLTTALVSFWGIIKAVAIGFASLVGFLVSSPLLVVGILVGAFAWIAYKWDEVVEGAKHLWGGMIYWMGAALDWLGVDVVKIKEWFVDIFTYVGDQLSEMISKTAEWLAMIPGYGWAMEKIGVAANYYFGDPNVAAPSVQGRGGANDTLDINVSDENNRVQLGGSATTSKNFRITQPDTGGM